MSGVSGSSEAADALRVALVQDIQIINKYVNYQFALLRRLSASCRDESYEMMERLVKYTDLKMRELMPEAQKTCKHLQAYSDFINSIETRYCVGTGSSGGKKMTGETWTKTNDGMQFDSPDTLARKLDIQQGKEGPSGTCGLCSVENVAIMAGLDVTEKSVLELADSKGLCDISGGTCPDERQALLKELGINSTLETPTIDNIAAAVMSGRGVILSVDAFRLYKMNSQSVGPHAITVTSVTTDKKGKITGITICDSNAKTLGDTGAKTYSVAEIQNALLNRPMNVTDPIR